MARPRYKVSSRLQLSNGDLAQSYYGLLGILQPGDTLLNTRISLMGASAVNYPSDLGEELLKFQGPVTLGVCIGYGATDPGPPGQIPSSEGDVDWVLRDAMQWRVCYTQPGSTTSSGKVFLQPDASNPYVSHGMRKTPLGVGGYVYAACDVWIGQGDEAITPDFAAPPSIVYTLIVAQA